MNTWVRKSIDIANRAGYLDKLHAIYPVSKNPNRKIGRYDLSLIKKSYKGKDRKKLIESLFKLEKFPFDDPYVPSLRKSSFWFQSNPKTIKRIGSQLFELTLDDLLEAIIKPKVPNRQLGSLFKNWINKIGYPILDPNNFLKTNQKISFLKGSDRGLKNFANNHLGLNLSKGLDLIAKIKNKFVIGEAKFIGDFGGNQDQHITDAISVVKKTSERVIGIGVLDGVVWLKTKNEMHNRIKALNGIALSALLLKDFLEDLSR